MATISSVSTAHPVYQAEGARSRVQQARREADQAQQNATALQAQAQAAQRVADRARENARALTAEAAATPDATTALPQSPAKAVSASAPLSASPYVLASQLLTASLNSALNTQNQTSGQILNARA